MVIRNAGKRRKSAGRVSTKKRASRKRASRKRSKAKGRRIRPVIIKVGKTFRRPKRSRTFKRATRINPKRNSRRRTRRNPKLSLRGVFNKANLITIGSLGLGVMSWSYIKGYTLKSIEGNASTAKAAGYIGAVPLIIGLLMVSMSRKPMLRNIGMGIGAIGVYDLLATNVSTLKLVPPSASLSGSYPVSMGANYSARSSALGTPGYGRPPAVSKHYMSVSGNSDNPYADLQF
jgi:hypothetical protein